MAEPMRPVVEQEIHHYNHPAPTVGVKVERNSRGFNFEISIQGCSDVSTAMALYDEATAELNKRLPVLPPETK